MKMINKVLSALIAAAYLATAYFTDGGEPTFRVGIFLILPIACIWYGESIGFYVGSVGGDYISSSTPGCLVVAGG